MMLPKKLKGRKRLTLVDTLGLFLQGALFLIVVTVLPDGIVGGLTNSYTILNQILVYLLILQDII
jgi:hypothetical protein